MLVNMIHAVICKDPVNFRESELLAGEGDKLCA
jgi:hypothetical protein